MARPVTVEVSEVSVQMASLVSEKMAFLMVTMNGFALPPAVKVSGVSEQMASSMEMPL